VPHPKLILRLMSLGWGTDNPSKQRCGPGRQPKTSSVLKRGTPRRDLVSMESLVSHWISQRLSLPKQRRESLDGALQMMQLGGRL